MEGEFRQRETISESIIVEGGQIVFLTRLACTGA